MKITVVGLGTDEGDLTLKGYQAIKNADTVVLKTALAKSARSLQAVTNDYVSLDFIYEKSKSFDTLNRNLTKEVLRLAKESNVVYCVDGAASEDNSVKLLAKRAKNIEIIEGVSKISKAIALVNLPTCSYSALSAYEAVTLQQVEGALVIYDLDSAFLAGDVKLKLCDLVGEETKIWYIRDNKAILIPVYELDRMDAYDYSSVAIVPPIDLLNKSRFTFNDLVTIVRLLRAPDGCPWDRAQTNLSIRQNLIEEAYELADAIANDDVENMIEESGDVLLQSVFHAVIKEESYEYNVNDVLYGICNKLISRHSHIFGTDKATNAEGALSVWEQNKKQEKHHQTYSDAVNDVPKSFPATMRAQKVQKRAAKANFDFSSATAALEKSREELDELHEALTNGSNDNVFEEMGDLLFSAINVGRLAHIDCEEALNASTEKFIRRFCKTEELILNDNKQICDLSEDEIDVYYRKAKDLCR